MSQYRLDINGTIGLGDYSNIYDYMSVIGEEDNLTVTIGPGNVENLDIICNILEHNNFNIVTKGGHENGTLYISAYREKQSFQ